MSKKQKMVLCRNCNAAIAKKAKICPSCGVKNKKPFYRRWWFILLVIAVGIGTFNSVKRKEEEKFEWNEVELCDRLPEPKSNVGDIFNNNSDILYMDIEGISQGEYKKYIEACQTMGYTIESEKNGEAYNAFDEEGYQLSLSCIGETMNITLDAPEELGTLNWPNSEIASLLPIPQSAVGKVSRDSSDGCYIYVGETSLEDFNTYADECAEYGFSIDYKRGDKFYNAEDESGNKVSLKYQGNSVMSVEIKKAAEETEAETESKALAEEETEAKAAEISEPAENTELVDGMRPEFKSAMDSYEEFMNEYCDFMDKYKESDGTDLKLLADYATFVSKYASFVKEFEAWDNEEMNTTETAYYMDVQTRISKKLLEVAG